VRLDVLVVVDGLSDPTDHVEMATTSLTMLQETVAIERRTRGEAFVRNQRQTEEADSAWDECRSRAEEQVTLEAAGERTVNCQPARGGVQTQAASHARVVNSAEEAAGAAIAADATTVVGELVLKGQTALNGLYRASSLPFLSSRPHIGFISCLFVVLLLIRCLNILLEIIWLSKCLL